MYNKLFTKILDSSIWLEQSPTRIIWVTLIAAMDESGFAQFASVANLSHRARVTLDEGNAAVTVLESPDVNSADPEHEGRRIERVPGGWMVLNSEKYRDLVTRATIQDQTRLRVAKHRAKKKGCNADVTEGNEKLTPSESESESESSNTPARVSGCEAPASVAEAQSWSVGQTEIIPAECVQAWHDDRTRAGWTYVKQGIECDIRDWRADLRTYARSWRNVESERKQRQNGNANHRTNHKSDPANKPGRYAGIVPKPGGGAARVGL